MFVSFVMVPKDYYHHGVPFVSVNIIILDTAKKAVNWQMIIFTSIVQTKAWHEQNKISLTTKDTWAAIR